MLVKYHARIYVTLRPSVLDPAGTAVESGLTQLGYEGVEGVRIGKYIELNLVAANERDANTKLDLGTQMTLAYFLHGGGQTQKHTDCGSHWTLSATQNILGLVCPSTLDFFTGCRDDGALVSNNKESTTAQHQRATRRFGVSARDP